MYKFTSERLGWEKRKRNVVISKYEEWLSISSTDIRRHHHSTRVPECVHKQPSTTFRASSVNKRKTFFSCTIFFPPLSTTTPRSDCLCLSSCSECGRRKQVLCTWKTKSIFATGSAPSLSVFILHAEDGGREWCECEKEMRIRNNNNTRIGIFLFFPSPSCVWRWKISLFISLRFYIRCAERLYTEKLVIYAFTFLPSLLHAVAVCCVSSEFPPSQSRKFNDSTEHFPENCY